MPTPFPHKSASLKKELRRLGQTLRNRRKQLGISAVTTAEAAGMSRVTLHRIESGESSVAVGAYLSLTLALGLKIDLTEGEGPEPNRRHELLDPNSKILKKIRISDYKQLKRLAWQMKDTQEISPKEALDLYERNWKHVDTENMEKKEKELLRALLTLFGRGRLLV